MRFLQSLKTDLSVVAALAGLGLLSAAVRQPARQERRYPASDTGRLAALAAHRGRPSGFAARSKVDKIVSLSVPFFGDAAVSPREPLDPVWEHDLNSTR